MCTAPCPAMPVDGENPTYYQVCDGITGHAEVVQIAFDPTIMTFEDILYVFWRTHDPTTLNRQGYDVGTQYRSAFCITASSKEPWRKNPSVTPRRPGSGPDLWSRRLALYHVLQG